MCIGANVQSAFHVAAGQCIRRALVYVDIRMETVCHLSDWIMLGGATQASLNIPSLISWIFF